MLPSAFLPFQRLLVFARQTLVNTRQTQIHRDKETAKRINPNIDFAAFEVGHQTLRYACFLCKLALRHALSRRLALSHTETAGGVRSIIVVLLEFPWKTYLIQVFQKICKLALLQFSFCPLDFAVAFHLVNNQNKYRRKHQSDPQNCLAGRWLI